MSTPELNKIIDYNDVDYTGVMRLSRIFEIFGNIATIGAIELGLWSLDMMENYGWIVSKQTLHLNTPINIDDDIKFTTKIGKPSMVIYPRYYFIEKEGEIIGECSSLWTMIDLKKRRIMAPKRMGIMMKNVEDEDYGNLDRPETIEDDENMTYVGSRQVLYSDVDTNKHMNNTRYIDWVLDLLDFDVFLENFIDEISINYVKEIPPLKEVDLYMIDKDHYKVIKGAVEGETSFLIKLHFKKKVS